MGAPPLHPLAAEDVCCIVGDARSRADHQGEIRRAGRGSGGPRSNISVVQTDGGRARPRRGTHSIEGRPLVDEGRRRRSADSPTQGHDRALKVMIAHRCILNMT
jgi:hypothetical protein